MIAQPDQSVPDASRLIQPPGASSQIAEQFAAIKDRLDSAGADLDALGKTIGVPAASEPSRLDIFNGYVGVFVVSFLIALVATPLMRRLAIANGIVDRPGEARKQHKLPIAYLGGVGVYLGIVAGILFSYSASWHGLIQFHAVKPVHLSEVGTPLPVPFSIVLGMTVIMVIGLLDDVVNISPWQKVGGQLLAAAFLAMEEVGVKVAYQVLYPIGNWMGYGAEIAASQKWVLFTIPAMGGGTMGFDLVYWTGTAIIAVFVLGACNASNLIDGLDGLLSGVTSIANGGLLIVALGLAAADAGRFDAALVVLCLAVLGGCLGFLPHNFNPAVIFLGDCGSLLLGFSTIVTVLMLGDSGRTDLVLAGLVIYAVPILDTVLAIIRRKLSGKSIADADDQHLHHMFKRTLGVKGAVFALYGIGVLFAGLGILLTMGRARLTYTAAAVIALFICITAIKVARRRALEEQMLATGNAPPPRGGDVRPHAPIAPARANPAASPSPPAS